MKRKIAKMGSVYALFMVSCVFGAEEKLPQNEKEQNQKELQKILQVNEIGTPLLADEEEEAPEEDPIADNGNRGQGRNLDRKPNLWDKNQQRILNQRVQRTHDGTYPETRVSNSN